jgi:hypothetical protein
MGEIAEILDRQLSELEVVKNELSRREPRCNSWFSRIIASRRALRHVKLLEQALRRTDLEWREAKRLLTEAPLLCDSNVFDNVGRSFLDLAETGVSSLDSLEEAQHCLPWLAYRPWRLRYRLRVLRDGWERIRRLAQQWPYRDDERIKAARAAFKRGEGVDVRDILREFHAQDS